jgi:hypothetical protein
MQKRAFAIALSIVAGQSALGHADDENSMFSFKGFGTLGVVHSSEDEADFRGNVFQPNGAGRTHEWDLGVDSKLGGQVSAQFTDKVSGIVQLVAQHQFDNSYRPLLEWANLKYQVTDGLSVRGGRIVLPSQLVSDSRFVGYAQPWIRPPQEVYFVSSITNSDGADVTYQSAIGGATNTAQAFVGTSDAKLASGRVQAQPAWGINDTVEIDSWTLRAAFISLNIDLEIDSFDPLLGGLDQVGDAADALGFPVAAVQAHALADNYGTSDLDIRIYTIGANYDPGSWFAMAEYVHFNGDGFLLDADSGYVSAGIRIDKFTPYVTYAQLKTDEANAAVIDTTGMPAVLAGGANALAGGINQSLRGFTNSQKSYSAGVRWDFSRSADLKIQYDRLTLEDGTTGRLGNAAPGFAPQDGDHVDIFSAAIDFVF